MTPAVLALLLSLAAPLMAPVSAGPSQPAPANPIGTAVLGYRTGDVVDWEVPAGRRRFRIEAVAV